jgi:hypothetical protein
MPNILAIENKNAQNQKLSLSSIRAYNNQCFTKRRTRSIKIGHFFDNYSLIYIRITQGFEKDLQFNTDDQRLLYSEIKTQAIPSLFCETRSKKSVEVYMGRNLLCI